MPNYTLYYFNGRGRAEICRMLFAAGGVQYNDKRIEFSEWERCRNDFPCKRLPCLEIDSGNKIPEMMSISRHLAREFVWTECHDHQVRNDVIQMKKILREFKEYWIPNFGKIKKDDNALCIFSSGFYPNNNMDMFRCDYICDCFYEMINDYMRYFHEKNGRFRQFSDDGMMGTEMQSRSTMQTRGEMGEGYENYLQSIFMRSFNRIMPFLEKTLCMKNSGNQFFMGEQMMWCDMFCYSFMENVMVDNQSMFSSYPKMMALYNRVASHSKICSYLKSRCNTNW